MSTNCCINCQSKRLVYRKETDAYKCLDCSYEYQKQYFFISHSHLDIEKVRIIRNIIEETFFYEPILFFLKCLSDENEIQTLIQREINERIWFVYCDSENARKSEYVKKEREIVNNLIASGKKINLVNIELDKFNIWDDGCYDYIRNQIAYRIRKTKIFISYQRKDSPFASRIKDYLINRGFSVWTDLDVSSGDLWNVAVDSAIKEHSYKNGLFLLLTSETDVNSCARPNAHPSYVVGLSRSQVSPGRRSSKVYEQWHIFPLTSYRPSALICSICAINWQMGQFSPVQSWW